MSNWMGVSGATSASSESTERAGDGSEPTELMLLARPVRPLLDGRQRERERERERKRMMTGLHNEIWTTCGPTSINNGSRQQVVRVLVIITLT